jgi:hypothetical protein
MSIERDGTRKPSPCPEDEGCKELPRQQSGAAQRSGGVSVDGMSGNDDRVNQEICSSACCPSEQPGVQAGLTGEALEAGAEVGVSRSSVEARKSTPRASQGEALVFKRAKRATDRGWLGNQILTPQMFRSSSGRYVGKQRQNLRMAKPKAIQ